MNKRIYKIQNRLRIKWKNSLLRRNIKLRLEIKELKDLLEETRKINHKLIDQKTLDNIKIRELSLK